MNTMHAIAAAALACAAVAAPAQPIADATRPGADESGQVLGGPMRHDLLFMASAQLDQERIVQGAPYCADAVQESVQVLADGNRIVQRQGSRQCRDGQGRTRQEITTAGGRVKTYLRDPIAHEAWMLDADRKLAIRLDGPPLAMGAPAEGRVWDRVILWGHGLGERLRQVFRAEPQTPPPLPDAPPEPRRAGSAPHDGIGIPGLPLPIALHARLLGPRGPGTTTLLPADTIEGLRAEGKRTVWTIEAGRIGNEKPITIVNEVWSSPELGITLRTRDADPAVGEASLRVRNVVRGEPPAELFRVPGEFAKVSSPAAMMRARH